MSTSTAQIDLPRKNGFRGFVVSTLKRQEVGIIIVVVVLAIIVDTLNSRFLTTANIYNILETIAVIGIISVGQTFVLIAREIDLSVGSVLALAGVVTAELYSAGVPPILAAVGGLALGALTGFIIGFVVVVGKVSSFIVTLGMLSIAEGVTLLVTGGIPVSMPSQLSFIGQGELPGGFPISVLLFIVVAALGQILLTSTVFGHRVTAIGDNAAAARTAGISVGRTRIATFVIIGVLAAMAGLVFSTQVGVADPQAGNGYELNVIAAAVIGGASLSGGRGSIVGAFFGACLLGLLQDAFIILSLSSFFQEVAIGLVIVLAALFDQLRQGNFGSVRQVLSRRLFGRPE